MSESRKYEFTIILALTISMIDYINFTA
jgi:hypothetical protein